MERFLAELAGRPELITGSSQLLFGGMGRLSESSVINTKNTSHSVTADIEMPDGAPSGVLIAQGGAFGGWSLYLLEGVPTYCYNLFGVTRTFVRGAGPSRPATTRSGPSSPTTAGWAGRPPSPCSSTARRSVRGASNAPSRWCTPTTRPPMSGVTPDRPSARSTTSRRSRFPGTVNWVQIDVGADDADHLISADERWRVSMARQ